MLGLAEPPIRTTPSGDIQLVWLVRGCSRVWEVLQLLSEKVRQLVIVFESWPPHTSSPDCVCADLPCGSRGKMHLKEFISSFPAKPPRDPPTSVKCPSSSFMPPVTMTPTDTFYFFSVRECQEREKETFKYCQKTKTLLFKVYIAFVAMVYNIL